VDICPLAASTPEGAAAVGRDGTLILFRDVLRDRNPSTVRYDSVQGTAYRLLCARGNLFLLTSKGLYVITGLVDHFLDGSRNKPVTPVLVIPMEAVDANLGSNEWLWIVTSEGVLRFDVELLESIKPKDLTQGEIREQSPTRLTPIWHEQRVEQESRAVAPAA
jgi:hypothetical protein